MHNKLYLTYISNIIFDEGYSTNIFEYIQENNLFLITLRTETTRSNTILQKNKTIFFILSNNWQLHKFEKKKRPKKVRIERRLTIGCG